MQWLLLCYRNFKLLQSMYATFIYLCIVSICHRYQLRNKDNSKNFSRIIEVKNIEIQELLLQLQGVNKSVEAIMARTEESPTTAGPVKLSAVNLTTSCEFDPIRKCRISEHNLPHTPPPLRDSIKKNTKTQKHGRRGKEHPAVWSAGLWILVCSLGHPSVHSGAGGVHCIRLAHSTPAQYFEQCVDDIYGVPGVDKWPMPITTSLQPRGRSSALMCIDGGGTQQYPLLLKVTPPSLYQLP